MPGTPDQVGDKVTSEYRDSRFAELESQIEAAEATRQRRPVVKPKRRRHRPRPPLPREVRKEIMRCAQQLRQHRKLFIADPKLKDRAARFLRSLLPPRRKRGRPGIDSITKAIRLLKLVKYPSEKPELIWKRVYPEAIAGYADMDRERQKAERLLLCERVRSRRNRHQKILFNVGKSDRECAVRFTRDVLEDPDRAEEIADESLENYAAKRKIQITNPSKRRNIIMATSKSKAELEAEVADLQDENQELQRASLQAASTRSRCAPCARLPGSSSVLLFTDSRAVPREEMEFSRSTVVLNASLSV